MTGEYLLANSSPPAGTRLAAIAELFDPTTFRHLDSLGVAPGWRCWEVGAGGPSVPAWLAARVGPAGRVLATDIDPSLLPPVPGVEVSRHDVARDDLPAEDFDLVHARLVLVHVEQREEVLTRLAAALRPGGALLIEDADPALQPLCCPDECGPEQRRANALRRAFRTLLERRGADLGYARSLPRLLRAAGLVEVAADVFFPLAAPAAAVLEQATVAQVRRDLVGAGLATDAELDAHLAAVAAGRLDLATAPLVSAWGHRP